MRYNIIMKMRWAIWCKRLGMKPDKYINPGRRWNYKGLAWEIDPVRSTFTRVRSDRVYLIPTSLMELEKILANEIEAANFERKL